MVMPGTHCTARVFPVCFWNALAAVYERLHKLYNPAESQRRAAYASPREGECCTKVA